MPGLINEILDLAAIASGKVSLSSDSVSLAEVMSECQAMREPEAQPRGISVTFPRFATPFFVSADRPRLKPTVISLLSHAIKYNQEQGTIVVDCAADSRLPKNMNSTAPLTGSLVVGEHHLTDGQLLAKTREFYANARTV